MDHHHEAAILICASKEIVLCKDVRKQDHQAEKSVSSYAYSPFQHCIMPSSLFLPWS